MSPALLLIFLLSPVFSVPIDNGLAFEPYVECGGDYITAYFYTRNPFHGHVFAKGFYDDVNCRVDYSPIANNRISIRIPIQLCGVRRLRSVNPPGLYQSVVLIVTFHPFFVTKVDRAINLNCFYMESIKVVTNALDVSMMATEVREVAVTMPPCRYEVLNYESSTVIPLDIAYLAPVRYARVGQSVLHRWQCNTETLGVFCMTVHSCTVDDGLGHSIRILDEYGCALDKYILGNVQYISETVAQRESHVFKYADKTQVYFQCQITLTFKNGPVQPCPRPICPEPTRGKRNTPNVTATVPPERSIITDVSRAISVLDLDEYTDRSSEEKTSTRGSSNVCLNAAALGLFITLFGIMATTTIASAMIRKNRRSCDCVELLDAKKPLA